MSDRSRAVGVAALPRIADLGLHRIAYLLLTFQVCAALLVVALLPVVGLSIVWRTFVPAILFDGFLVAVWICLWRIARHPRECAVAEAILAVLLTFGLTQVLAPAQYVAAAFNRPLIDPFLARADALMGIDVSTLAQWSRAHPRINVVMLVAYSSFIVQLILIPPILAVVLRDRLALWEYLFNFHLCAAITVTSLAIFPAACAFQYLGFESTIDQARFIAHFNGLRDGSFTLIEMHDLEGLISMPSFHMAGALMVLWALRRHVPLLAVVGAINGLLILATVMSGAHYVVDLFATVLMFAGSVWVWRTWGEKLLDAKTVDVPGSDARAGIVSGRAGW